MPEDQEPEPTPLGQRDAASALLEAFGPLVDEDYVPGKTLFRDTLCYRFGLSLLEAEDLCDELERAALIVFVRADEGVGWHIHLE